MRDVTLVVFHTPARPDDPPLTRLLATGRESLLLRHVRMFAAAGAARTVIVGRIGAGASPVGAGARDRAASEGASVHDATSPTVPAAELPPLRLVRAGSFGEALATVVADDGIEGCVVLGSGSVPLLRPDDAVRLVSAAQGGAARDGSGRRHAARGTPQVVRGVALTNNRYSSDVCAVSDARTLADLPPLPSDNALPRWLEEIAGYAVSELPGRDRLALDLDTPLDLALLALSTGAPADLRRLAATAGLEVPRLAAFRDLAADPRRELLVFGRSSSRTLAWLERHVRCRVRFLAEERGMRASSPLAIGSGATARGAAGTGSREAGAGRPPRATLGRLLADRGPSALPAVVGDLADGAILDTRVLLADRLGLDEATWPSAEDRFASDLLRPEGIRDPWLRTLTEAATTARLPILLGGHTLVGPGVPLLLRGIR